MKVSSLLQRKDARIIAIQMEATTAIAARLLRAENVGAVIIKDTCATEGDVVLGILSERDILRALVDRGIAALKMPVSALMTRDVVSCGPGDELDLVAALMERHQIRYVPVIDGDALIGVVSIRDLLAQRATGELELTAF
ncbi:MAG: histidine kinase [Rhodopila sp.]|nr:histidine kinase [Rhodopila sp.]